MMLWWIWKIFLYRDIEKGKDETNKNVKCNKLKKLKNPKTLYIFDKKLVLLIIFCKCGNKSEGMCKEEEIIEILNILGLCE